MISQLGGSRPNTYDAISRHPAVRNLAWKDVRSMFSAPAEVVEEPNGRLKISVFAGTARSPRRGTRE